MSKSFKKNPVKKINGRSKRDYWSKIRNKTKNIINSIPIEDIDENLPDPKELINDYNYVDNVWRNEEDETYYRK